MDTRGVRNNNPGNIRKTNDPWQGLSPQQLDPAFFQFSEAYWGIRAMARVLINYYDRSQLDTVAKVINRWAPPQDQNNTSAYVSRVCDETQFAPNEKLDLHKYEHMKPLVVAMIKVECSNYVYPDAVVDRGLALAGIEPPSKSLVNSRTIQGALASTVGTVATAGLPVLQGLSDHAAVLQPLVTYSSWIKTAFIVSTLAGVAAIVWARIDDARKLNR